MCTSIVLGCCSVELYRVAVLDDQLCDWIRFTPVPDRASVLSRFVALDFALVMASACKAISYRIVSVALSCRCRKATQWWRKFFSVMLFPTIVRNCDFGAIWILQSSAHSDNAAYLANISANQFSHNTACGCVWDINSCISSSN